MIQYSVSGVGPVPNRALTTHSRPAATVPVVGTSRLGSGEKESKGSGALAQRLMYGTDWEMIVREGAEIRGYFARFEAMFQAFDTDSSLGAQGVLSDNFFGWNAVEYLGLRQGRGNRARLDAFYARSGIKAPYWMNKVDGIKVVATAG